MDGFVLILAIIVFSVFKNVMQEAKKKQGKSSLPDVFDTIAEHDDSRERAEEALRKWEAKQRSLPAPRAETRAGRAALPNEPMRIPRPNEHRTDVRLTSPGRLKQETSRQQSSWRQSARRSQRQAVDLTRSRTSEQETPDAAERTRQDAYDAIRQLLGGQVRLPDPMKGGSMPALRPERRPDVRPAEAIPAARAGSGLSRRTESAPATRPRIQGTLARKREEESRRIEALGLPAADSGRAGSAAGLARLDKLPPVARGIMYAELLGTPLGLREPRKVIGD